MPAPPAAQRLSLPPSAFAQEPINGHPLLSLPLIGRRRSALLRTHALTQCDAFLSPYFCRTGATSLLTLAVPSKCAVKIRITAPLIGEEHRYREANEVPQ